jgi:cytochrome c oxidase subunit 4
MKSRVVPVTTSFLVWAGLLILLVLTVGISEFNLGIVNTAAALSIAGIKMLLVILFFMHVRYQSRVTWIFAAAGFFWFLIMVTLTMSDYLTRHPVKPPYDTTGPAQVSESSLHP